MDSNCCIALKEWAVVQRALLTGKQIILLRKGGLVEETGQFELRARQFLIQPTYIHLNERKSDIQPEYLDWLHEEESRRTSDGIIRFEAVCEAVNCIEVKRSDALMRLSDQHIWSESYINMRLNWEPYKPLFAIIIRAYKLPEPIEIPAHRDYFGCTSWIDLKKAVNVEGATAVIGDDEFQERIEPVMRSLG